MIPHSRPCLGPAEADAAARVVRSGHPAQGAEVAALESELARRIGVPHAVAVSSGTAALYLCLLALGAGPGHEIVFPSYVCAALLHATRRTGARPVLVDLDPPGFNVAASTWDRAITPAARALILPHTFGAVAPFPALSRDVPIIEDCAMSLGARDGNRPAGAAGKASVFSFYATKVICAGEGGAVATADEALADSLRDLRDGDGKDDTRPRFNFKLTDLQAAVARVQLSLRDGFLARRRDLGGRYDRSLLECNVILPAFGPGGFPYRYVVRHTGGADRVIAAFDRAGVAARKPVAFPLHRALGLSDATFPETARAHHGAVSLPLYPDLKEDEIVAVLDGARSIL